MRLWLTFAALWLLPFQFDGQIHGQNDSGPENFGEVFQSERFLLGKNIFKGDVGYSASQISFRDQSGDFREFFRHTLKFNLNINPWRDLYFKNTFFIPLHSISDKPHWISDYYFSLGYYNWRNHSFSFGYENYQPNNFDQLSPNDFWSNIKRSYFFLDYNLTFENPHGYKFFPPTLDETSRVIIKPTFKIHPEYQDAENEFAGHLKVVLGGSVRYVILRNFYIEASAWYYPDKKTKLPWDPDFTYGFGRFDWRAFKFNFSYGNYIANRFPWNEKELDHHGFLNGELYLNMTYSW